jgi:hypothetical protein
VLESLVLTFGISGASSFPSKRLRKALSPPGGRALCVRGCSAVCDVFSLAIRSAKDCPGWDELLDDLQYIMESSASPVSLEEHRLLLT